MSFPDKLPFTVFAVGIAAAFQASGATSPFWTSVVWSIVILASITEATVWFLNQVSWRRLIKVSFALAVAVIVVPLISLVIIWQAYKKEFSAADFSVTFNVAHPAKIGTDRLDLNYLILNKGSTPLLIEEVLAVELSTTDFSNNPARNGSLCASQVMGIPGRGNTERFSHPGQTVLHETQIRPELTPAFTRGDPPPFQDDEKLDAAIYEPKSVTSNEKDIGIRAFVVEKASSVTATFDTDPAVWSAHNVMVICGAIKYLASNGQEMWAVCPAQLRAQIYQDGKPLGEIGGPAGPRSFTIYSATSSGGLCGVRASY
jgi:hypothetical protein